MPLARKKSSCVRDRIFLKGLLKGVFKLSLIGALTGFSERNEKSNEEPGRTKLRLKARSDKTDVATARDQNPGVTTRLS